MKLILAIISDNDSDLVSQALIKDGFRVTRVASTGGFLRRGSTTLMVGVADDKVDQAIETIRKNLSPQTDPKLHRGTLFVIPVQDFTQI